MEHIGRWAHFILFFSLITPGLLAQTGSDSINQATTAYEAGSFNNAFSIISAGVSEINEDEGLRRAAAHALTGISIREFDKRNYRNAYAGFHKSLLLSATDTLATKYFVSMRMEMDITSLANADDIAPVIAREIAPVLVLAPAPSLSPLSAVESSPAATEDASLWLPPLAVEVGLLDSSMGTTSSSATLGKTLWFIIITSIGFVVLCSFAIILRVVHSRHLHRKDSHRPNAKSIKRG